MSDDKKHEPAKEKQAASPSRLGREAKIGVTVIVALLILLTVVVVRRVTAPDPDELATATPADRERQEKEKLAAAEQEKSSADPRSRADDPPSQGKRFASSQATIVPPKAESAKPPKAGDGDSDPWKLPGDKSEQSARADKLKPLEGSGSPPLPPPFMTVPPKSTASSMPKAATSTTAEPRSRYDVVAGTSHADSQAVGASKGADEASGLSKSADGASGAIQSKLRGAVPAAHCFASH